MKAMVLALLLVGACGGESDEAPGEAPSERIVRLDPDHLDIAGVRFETAQPGVLPQTLDLPGTLLLDPTREAWIGSPADGRVVRILVHAGQEVEAGQVLAVVQSTAVATARAEALAAESRRAAAVARRDRVDLLLAEGIASTAQLLDAKAELAEAEAALSTARQTLAVFGVAPGGEGPELTLRAPIGGELLQVAATTGAWVSPGTDLFHLGDRDELVLVLNAPDARVPDIAAGQAVVFEPGGVHADGVIEAVTPWIDPSSRSVSVRARVPNADRRLLPNQTGRGRISLGAGPQGIVLPEDAVQDLEGASVVFVELAPGTFGPKPVTVAARADGAVLIGGGVEAGDRVVTSGAFALKGQLVAADLGGDDD